MSSRNLAPIILFAYNRPWHLSQTLGALQNNVLASESVLYIYCDGPKVGDTKSQLEVIEATRRVANQASGFKSVSIVERPHNFGLAQNIITGVTEIINQYGRIIVLEDDIVTSPGFLQYMNDALDLYADEDRVMHVSGYWFPVSKTKVVSTFFYRVPNPWGWATWSKAWKNLETNPAKLDIAILRMDPKYLKFNVNNIYPFSEHLNANIIGSMDTWAIKWYASIFIQNCLCLYPTHSLVQNIGHDGSGAHCVKSEKYNIELFKNKIQVSKIKILESRIAIRQVKRFYGQKKSLRSMVKKILPAWLVDIIKKYD